MLKRLIRNRVRAMARRYDYDMTYALELLEADTRAFLAFARIGGMSRYRRDVPIAPWYAAKMIGAMHEDCGPCTQLVVAMADEAGVAPTTLTALVRGDDDALDDDVRLVARWARACLAHAIEAEAMRVTIVQRWGMRGLASLAFALASARVFPTVKYALGHGHACTRVVVAGEALVPAGARA